MSNYIELRDARTSYEVDDRDGYIKLDRNLLRNSVFQNEKLLKVWMWCLLKAFHKPAKALIGLKTVHIQKGQFCTGRHKAASELNMTPSTVWKYLKVLQNLEKIDITSNSKFSVVTVVNWEFYQEIKYPSDSKHDSKVTANEQQSNSNVTHTRRSKNDKNEKKVIKKHYAEFVTMTEAEHQKLIDQHGETFTARCIEVLDNYKGSTGKRYKSDYRTILNWVVKRVTEENQKPLTKQPSRNAEPRGFSAIRDYIKEEGL